MRRIDSRKTMNRAHAKASRVTIAAFNRLQNAIPPGAIDADSPDLDSVLSAIQSPTRVNCSAKAASWSIVVPQPSWNPMSSCFRESTVFLCRTRDAYRVPLPSASKVMIAVNGGVRSPYMRVETISQMRDALYGAMMRRSPI